MQKRSGYWWVLAALLAASGPGLAAELQTAAVSYQTVPTQRLFDATVEAVNQATVSAQINGRIVGIYFDVHDYVPRGQVIISFKDTEQRTQLEAANATLREAEARLNEAQIEFQRVEQIYERRLVAKSALDKAKADLQAAKARVDSAKAGMRRAEELLAYTEVQAPYSGIVVKRLVEVGESVTVGQPLMTGLSLEQLRLTATLPQRVVSELQREQGVTVLMPNGETLAVPPEQLTVFPFADSASHTVRVRVELPLGIAGLNPGMLVKVVFATGDDRQLLIPRAAVVRRGELTGAYVVGSDGAVSLRQIRTGRQGPDAQVEVLAGLAENEQVALDPVEAAGKLKQGQGRP